MFIDSMRFWMLDWYGTLIASAFIGLIVSLVVGTVSHYNKKQLVNVSLVSVSFFAVVAVALVLQLGLLDRRFHTLFYVNSPQTLSQKIERRGMVITNLTYRRGMYEEARDEYLNEKKRLAKASRVTPADVREFADDQQEFVRKYEHTLMFRDSLKEHLVVAYVAGYEDDVRAIEVKPFDEPDPEMPHKKWSE